MKHELEEVATMEDVYAFSAQAEEALCAKLDELIGGNALLAARDGTLAAQLTPDMIDEDTLDLIQGTIFVEENLSISGDMPAIVDALVRALTGVALYFRFCDKPITAKWGSQLSECWIPESIQMLPETEYTAWVLTKGRAKGMSDEEIFAVMDYLCLGENDKIVQ